MQFKATINRNLDREADQNDFHDHESTILDVSAIEALRPRGGGKELDNQLRIWRQYQMKRPPGLVIWEAKKVMRKNPKENDDKIDALIQAIGMYQAKLDSLAP